MTEKEKESLDISSEDDIDTDEERIDRESTVADHQGESEKDDTLENNGENDVKRQYRRCLLYTSRCV